MRTRIIIAVISLAIGLFAGAKIMEHLGREYIVNNFPIPSGSLDDKDAYICLLYTSPSPRDFEASRMPSSA